jgi:hypothetical protein
VAAARREPWPGVDTPVLVAQAVRISIGVL